MPLYRYNFEDAQRNFSDENIYSRWFSNLEVSPNHAAQRLREEIFKPAVNVSRKIKRSENVFNIGSCFARSMERSLDRLGYSPLSIPRQDEFPDINRPAFLNRYNTASIRNELEWAAGVKDFSEDNFSEMDGGLVIDLQSHPIEGPKSRSKIENRRSRIIRYFSRALHSDFILVSLGLIEGWFDRRQNNYIGFAPIFGQYGKKRPILRDSDRFEFRVMDFNENMSNLEAIYDIIKRNSPKCHIIVTVSPNTLSATFSKRDVTVANMLSKSMLRTCAETWVRQHPDDITYFPGYEMAALSNKESVWSEDKMHVCGRFVDHLVEHFISNFIEGSEP